MKRLAAIGVVVLASTGLGVLPAIAGPTQSQTQTGTGQCYKPAAWGKNGAYAWAYSYDQIYWANATHLHTFQSTSHIELQDCYSGYRISPGVGTKRIDISWTVTGSKLSSCTVGFPTNTCTVNASETTQTGNYASSGTNTDGRIYVGSGTDDVYAGAGGTINQYTHRTSATFTYGSTYSTKANATTNFYIKL